ncbi:MAG: uroporphyrinogen-III C-methyltransferase [Candidatus Symbiobacter sp.]|nr:uroporphyrinogen-III C-methyltransferase [Candidatus Symbiobacter sp.]
MSQIPPHDTEKTPLPWPDAEWGGKGLPCFAPGTVWLTGAGPGDPGLLTILAWHGLQQADHVVYDALVDERILHLCPPHTILEFAGKRGGRPSPRQADISERLIALARDGRRVLRLKGGDPFVFGRGGEEALALARAGIAFRVVPGVTAGIGGLAYAGIPVTHRDTNCSVTFLTGHNTNGVVPDGINWAALAKGSEVIVAYMALKHLPTIARHLREGGRDAADAVAIISHATLPDQIVVETTLERLAEQGLLGLVDERGLPPAPPAIIVIGEVVKLRHVLAWYPQDREPGLAGCNQMGVTGSVA